MRQVSGEFDRWTEAAPDEAEHDDAPSSIDVLARAFRRLPLEAQDRVRRRLLEDCLRALASANGLLGQQGVGGRRPSADERGLLEHMCEALLPTVTLDVH